MTGRAAFSTFDYIAVVIYLVGIAAFGSSFYRRKSTAKDYFLGGRSMSWLPVGISIIAADLSAITVMGAPAWSFKNNLQFMWVAVGYPLVAPLAILVFVPFYSRLNLYTAYEYLERRFNLTVRLLVSLLFQALRGWHVAVAIYGPALVINMVTGLPVWESILVMGLFTTFYTALGGMKAVIWTDVIQFATVTSGIVLILVMAILRVPGGLGTVYRVASDAGKLKLLNLSLDPHELTSLFACIIGGAVLSLAPLTTDQAILQRLFTTKSTAECRQSVLLQAILVVPITWTLYILGVALFVFYHAHPAGMAGLTNADAVVPFFAVHELPVGISGLVIACIFAASMAVMSAGINSLTTASIVDIYQRVLRPNAPPEHYVAAGRLGTVAWGLVTTALALLALGGGDLVIMYPRVASILSGPTLGIFLLGTMARRANSTGVLTGAVAGAIAVTLTIGAGWSFLLYGPAGVLATLIVGYLASFFAERPPKSKVHGLVMGEGEPGSILPE